MLLEHDNMFICIISSIYSYYSVNEEVRERRRSEYKFWNRKVKELVKESKRKVDDEFGRKLSEKFGENKKFFGKCESEERGWKSCK